MFRHCLKNVTSINIRQIHETFDPSVLLKNVFELQKKEVSNSIMEKNMTQICQYYRNLNGNRDNFLTTLALNYSKNPNDISQLLKQIHEMNNILATIKLQNTLRNSLVPPYNWLFQQIARYQNDGIKFLVDFRWDLLKLIQSEQDNTTLICLQQMNKELKNMLSIWFCGGMLTLERITWQSSCEIMEKISIYEAVHPVRTWKDLKNRMGNDRRCFIYTHSSMPNEPLVILHTALQTAIPNSTESLVRVNNPENTNSHFDIKTASVAVFYSITSTQPGLKQIELGNCLIRRVIDEIRKECPHLTTFVTLSPIPQFRQWFLTQLKNCGEIKLKTLFTEDEIQLFMQFFNSSNEDEMRKSLKQFLDLQSNNLWLKNERFLHIFKNVILRICAQYLVNEKKRGYAFNIVENFHLRNGAQILRLNWFADKSKHGLDNSFGLMVNYNYDLKMIDVNSQQYIEEKLINFSDSIKIFLKTT